MVATASIAAMAFSLLLSLGAPAVLFWYLATRSTINSKAVGVGVMVFLVFTQLFEKLVHLYFLRWNVATAQLLENAWLYAVYGCLAAGIFEEGGRYLAFKFLLRKSRTWADGVSYGIGHGGAEAVLIGVLGTANNIVVAILINTGGLAAITDKVSGSQLEQLLLIKNALIGAPPELFLAGGFERVMAFLLQVALSLVVLYGVKQRNLVFLALAILLHAAVDFPVGLAQKGALGTWTVEALVLAAGILSAIFITRSTALFGTPAAIDTVQN